MRRREFLSTAGGMVAYPIVARAQTRRRTVKVGYLSATGYLTAPTGPDANISALRDGFTQLGQSEGKDYVIIAKYSGEDYGQFPNLTDELLGEKVDIIVAAGPASSIARMPGLPVPIVFAFSGDPVDAGLVTSLARPGGNATGVSLLALELAAKRVEILKEAAPTAKRLAVLTNPKHPGEKSERQATQQAARATGLTDAYYELNSARDFAQTFAMIERDQCDCLLAFPEALTTAHRQLIADFALRQKLPSMFGWKIFAQAGGLISYGPNIHDAYARLAVFVDKLLKGERPADIPVEQPTRLELAINLQSAKALGFVISPTLLARADEVIE